MLTRDELASVLEFDAEKGRFFWKGVGRCKPKGKEAGSFDAHGYGQINIFGKIWKEHRLVWLWVHGEFPTRQIDHINHDRRDNRPENLRLVDNIENHKNRPMQISNKSGFVGVWYDKRHNRYQAYISVDKKRINLGIFASFDAAVAARKEANLRYGYHQNHGSELGRPKHKRIKAALNDLGIGKVPGKLEKDDMEKVHSYLRGKS